MLKDDALNPIINTFKEFKGLSNLESECIYLKKNSERKKIELEVWPSMKDKMTIL